VPSPRKATGTWPACSARPPSRPAKPQTREGARYRRIARRRGKAKAQVALGNTQLTVYHKLPSCPGTRYQDLGPDYERQATTRRQIACHAGKLAALGFEVTLARISIPGLRRLSQQRSLTPGPNLHPASLTLRRVLPRAQLISISG
jgi:hypothetical protein